MLFVANAYVEGEIFEWIVTTFEKYTSYSIAEENELIKEKINVEFSYIPENFKLVDSFLLEHSDTYYYSNQDKILYIIIIYEAIPSEMNTENVKTDKFSVEGNKVITWEKETETYFVGGKSGIGYEIYGNIDRDEFTKIYNGILVKRK